MKKKCRISVEGLEYSGLFFSTILFIIFSSMEVCFIPEKEALFFWNPGKEDEWEDLLHIGGKVPFRVVNRFLSFPDPKKKDWKRKKIKGYEVSLPEASLYVLSLNRSRSSAVGSSIRTYALITRLALSLLHRGLYIPAPEGECFFMWKPLLFMEKDILFFRGVCRAAPPCVSVGEFPPPITDIILEQYLTFTVDTFVRKLSENVYKRYVSGRVFREEFLFLSSLLSPVSREFHPTPERKAIFDEVRRWGAVLVEPGKTGLILKLERGEKNWILHFLMHKRGELREADFTRRDILLQTHLLSRLFPPFASVLEKEVYHIVLADEELVEMLENHEVFKLLGINFMLPRELVVAPPRTKFRIRRKKDMRVKKYLDLYKILEFDWKIAIGDVELDDKTAERLLKKGERLVKIKDRWIFIDPEELKNLLHRRKKKPENPFEGMRLLLEAQDEAEMEEEVREFFRGFRKPRRIPIPSINGELRGYQVQGFRWLYTTTEMGFGVCLADDMGLGKTVQTIACIAVWRNEAQRPFLVVAPTSVIWNWKNEFEKFAPDVRVRIHAGQSRAKSAEELSPLPGEVIITSYSLLSRDKFLSEIEWEAVVLDEAQFIKNPGTERHRMAKRLRTERRIALTGTPVENRLTELWSIMNFLNPGMLGSLEFFKREFAFPVEVLGDEEVMMRLRRIVSPFILRREKTDKKIIKDLPDKFENRVLVTLTEEQASLYASLVEKELEDVLSGDKMKRRGRILRLLLRLKQICNHPSCYTNLPGTPEQSGKVMALLEMLEEVMENDERALIFTQFRETGELLVKFIHERFYERPFFMHGKISKKERRNMVDRFQKREGPHFFVLTLQTGGFGINLTEANHVFIFDRWWNPAVEQQAQDRAYRIGQRKDVFVHAFVTRGTVEEKIEKMLEEKKELFRSIVQPGMKFITELADDELRELFRLEA
ncbi:hypothetical protein DRQ18_00655 [bacterium]|nr:MAG: hypothetical protein DRQ18_00655 [bacterium]